MGAPDLIFQLRNAGYSIRADGGYIDISPADGLAPDLLEQLKRHKLELLSALEREQQREIRCERVLAMLEANLELKRAIHTDTDSDPDNVIFTMAIRHTATCEIALPKANYEPWQLLMLVDKAGADDVH